MRLDELRLQEVAVGRERFRFLEHRPRLVELRFARKARRPFHERGHLRRAFAVEALALGADLSLRGRRLLEPRDLRLREVMRLVEDQNLLVLLEGEGQVPRGLVLLGARQVLLDASLLFGVQVGLKDFLELPLGGLVGRSQQEHRDEQNEDESRGPPR